MNFEGIKKKPSFAFFFFTFEKLYPGRPSAGHVRNKNAKYLEVSSLFPLYWHVFKAANWPLTSNPKCVEKHFFTLLKKNVQVISVLLSIKFHSSKLLLQDI